MEETLEIVTEDVWGLEQQVTLGTMGDPEEFLDRMFRTRHALLAVSNIAATSLEIYDRMISVAHGVTEQDRHCWPTTSTSSAGRTAWPTCNASTCRESSSSTARAPTPR